MAGLTKDDIQAVLTDFLGKSVLPRLDAMEERVAKTTAGLNEAQITELIRRAGGDTAGRARGNGIDHFMPNEHSPDPFKGKGLDFVRFVKAQAISKRDSVDAVAVAKKLGYGEHIVKALSEGRYEDGGLFVPDQIGSDFIELLRPRVVFMQGTGSLDFKGSMTLNKQTAAGSASYIGEMMAIPVSQPKVGSVQLSAKKLAAIYAASNDLLRNPSAGAEALMREDMLRVIALIKDLVAYRGSGTQYTPRGVRYWIDPANVTVSQGNTLAQVVNDLILLCLKVEESEVGLTNPAFVFTSRVKWFLASLIDGQGNFVFRNEIAAGTLFGYPFRVMNQIPKNLGAGGDKTEIAFGEFSEIVWGQDTALQVEAFPNGAYEEAGQIVSGISKDATPIRALERHDMVLRHEKSFAVMTECAYKPTGA